MKKIILLLIPIFLFSSCKKENTSPEEIPGGWEDFEGLIAENDNPVTSVSEYNKDGGFIIVTTEPVSITENINSVTDAETVPNAPEITEEKTIISIETVHSHSEITSYEETYKKTTEKTNAPPDRNTFVQVENISAGRKTKDKTLNYITSAAAQSLNSGRTEEIVYVSGKSGTKYHFDRTCSNMTCVIAVTIAEAEEEGFGKCAKE